MATSAGKRVSKSSEERHAGIGAAAVAQRTGKTWREWFALLDGAAAVEWEHAAIARWLHARQKLDGWWAQMVTVAYEQARGKRVRHQTARGFSVSATKTIAASAAKVWPRLAEPRGRVRWLADADLTVRTLAKPRRILANFGGGATQVEFRLAPKGASKCSVTVEHMKLPDAKSAAQKKRYWSAALAQLAATSAAAGRRLPPG